MRGSSPLPKKTIERFAPGQPNIGFALRNAETSTPLGITTASPSTCLINVVLAASLTAIRADTFSIAVCASFESVNIIRDLSIDECQVATIGPLAAQHANTERLGASGSCTCSTSNSPLSIHLETLRAAIGPKLNLATEPLYLTALGLPVETT